MFFIKNTLTFLWYSERANKEFYGVTNFVLRYIDKQMKLYVNLELTDKFEFYKNFPLRNHEQNY